MGFLSFHHIGTFTSSFVLFVLCFNLILSFSLGLQVVPGSNCMGLCTGRVKTTNTTGSDFTCYDKDYNVTSVGITFKECVSCELQSATFDHATHQTDLGWALYNLRYATAWCLFGYPQVGFQTASTPCKDSCSSIAQVVETNLITPKKSTPYDYCRDPAFPLNAEVCASCYSKIPNQQYLSNFIHVLQTACKSQPSAIEYLPLSASQIFNVTPLSNSSNSTSAGSARSSGLSWNAKVAMSISIPVGVLLVSSLLCLWFYVHRSQRRRRRRRPKSDLAKSASQRSRRPQHKHTISADTAASREMPPSTGWRPYYKSPPLHAIPYPAPLRTRTSPTPTTGTSNISPRSKLPSNMVSTGTTLRATPSLRGMATLSPRPLSVNHRPPPPPRGLVSWEARGVQHARTKSMRESMRHSSESQGQTERVKVAMQVPRDANISEWKGETRTPTPNTEAGSGEKR